jgi:hypothetical protein
LANAKEAQFKKSINIKLKLEKKIEKQMKENSDI